MAMALTLIQATLDAHRSSVQEIFSEYLQWVKSELEQKMGVSFDPQAVLEQEMEKLPKYLPPDGQLLLAYDGDTLVGCAALRRIGLGVGEVKRMYVRPAHRRGGVGRALLVQLMDTARQTGYTTIRLDTPALFAAAQALYRSFGFQDINPYAGTDVPPEFHAGWVFMEAAL
jgi:GNAT superfamily N-acetyltransferase